MKKLQLFFIFLLLSGIGFAGINTPAPSISATSGQSVNAPALLTGPTSVCLNSTGNVYTTDPGQTNYIWSITGGTITSGGTSADNTATVTWTAAGAKSITVNYDGATATVLPVTVNPLTSSVAISASATSVYTGTSVTFTATPTNGGTTPAYQWKVNGNNAGTNSNVFTYTPSNGDAVYCILTPNAPCVSSSFTSAIITITVTSQPLLVTVSRLTANPGQVVYFPVKLKGASASGTPISAASLQITYDPAVLHYDTLVNFYASTPVTQWFFSGNLNTVAANWQEPGLNTVAIPDSTTLFEIQFTYLGGISTLPFTLNEFLDAQFNLVNTTHVDGAIAPFTPDLSGPVVVCEGSAGNVYTTGAGQTNYLWTVNGGTITAGGGIANNTVTVTWPSAGTHSVSVSYTGSATTTLPVTVTNPVIASSVAGTIACAGGTTNVTVSATGGTPPYSGTGDFTVGAGTYTYTVTDINGCSGTTTITVAEPAFFTLKATAASANGAEISAFDSASGRIYTVAGPVVEFYTLSNAGVLSSPTTVPLGFVAPAGTTAVPNSVAVKNGNVAVSFAIVGANNAQQEGRVAFYSAGTAAYISDVTVGYLPDMVTFTPDGTKVLTANEGEPNSYGQPTSFDPEGSVSIIDISAGVAAPTVTNAGFTSFNGQLATLKAAGVRIYGPGATVAMDLEPEYLTFSPDGSTAFVTLQENNAVAKLDIATATIMDIYPLGLKDHSIAGNSLDASDRDVNGTAGGGGKINMQNWPVKGMYEPDGIATFTAGGTPYYITANEGDSRAYTGFSEEIRVSDALYVLDPAVFPNAAILKMPANLGRLQLTNATGNTDGDSEFEEIHAFGARSFTIWNSSFTKVFDSQNELERITTVRNSAGFNSDGTAATFDSRSDNKGPEPEGIAIGTVNGVQYAFIGSERTGDIFVYDLSNPLAPVLKQYINTPADLGVEGVLFVSAGKSPTGKALLITSAEVSKTVSVYEFSAAPVITLLGNATEQVCQNTTYTDAGATAVDYLGNNITGSIVPTSTVNTALPGTYTVTYNVTDACGIAALPVTRTVIVNPAIVVGVSIVASANPVCAATSVTFTATPVTGGAPATYQWKKNGSNISGATNVTYTYVPVNNDAITFVLTSNGTPCVSGSPATSNAIAMTVYPLTASISITASANPVMAGTPVTFTANATNGGPAPSFQWKVNNTVIPGNSTSILTYTPENGDVIICILTSSAPCVTSLFTSNVINMTVNYPVGSLLVTLPNKTAMPGDVLYYPVKLKGASATGTPVSAASIQITYDPAVFHYDTLVNFYASTPVAQWFFSGNLNTVAANWQEPGLNAIAIPDSTTLFEIKFTYLGGNATLPFTVNEFTNAVYDLVPTNHINGGVTQLVPTNNTIQNLTVATAHDTCFSAIQVLTVAGSGTNVTIENGGSVTFVAGQQISLLPGTTVVSGGYLHGFITINGQYCTQLPNPVVIAKSTGEETTSISELTSSQSIRAYPNPTTGIFTVEVKGDDNAVMTKVEIFTISGMKVKTVNIDNERKHEFNLSGLNTGIYFIHVFTNERSEILKIVKL